MTWQLKTLDELGFVGRGRSRHRPRGDERLYGGDYPFIQTSDVQKAEFYIKDFTQTYSDFGFAQSKLWKKGTLCISIVGANTAESAILGIDACFPDSVIGFIANREVSNTAFVKYYLDTIKVQMKTISEGAARENLSMDKLLSMKLRVPNVVLQDKIASALSAYDDLIENNNQRIKLLEEMAEEIYKEWFVRMRFPGYQDCKFFDKKGNEVPHGTKDALPEMWGIKELNDIVDIISGFAFKSESFEETGKYRLVTIKNVQNGFFVTDTTDCIHELPKKLKEDIFIKDKDILLSLTGNIGRICLSYGDNYLLNQRVAKLKPRSDDLFEFVYMFFRSEILRKTLENLSNGAAQQNLSPIDMGNLKFGIPNQLLLEKYSGITSSFFEEIIALNKKKLVLQQTRDLLLPRLISGKLDVSKMSQQDFIDDGMDKIIRDKRNPVHQEIL